MEDTESNKPEKICKCGPVQAAVWSDSRIIDDTLVEVHSIKISKSYKDGEQWKYTNTFNIEDLPKISIAAMEIYRFFRIQISELDNIQSNSKS